MLKPTVVRIGKNPSSSRGGLAQALGTMSELSEVISTYFFFLLPWPTAFFFWANEMDAQLYVLAWALIGIVVGFITRWLKLRFVFLLWLAVWFMPATVICGSATLVPWAYALLMFTGKGGCSTPLSLATCLVFNVVLVFAAAKFANLLARRRAGA